MFEFVNRNGFNYKVYTRKNGTKYFKLNGKRTDVVNNIQRDLTKPCPQSMDKINGICRKKCKSPNRTRSPRTMKCEKKPRVTYFRRDPDNNDMFYVTYIDKKIHRVPVRVEARDNYVDLKKNILPTLQRLAMVVNLNLYDNERPKRKAVLVEELKKYVRFEDPE